MKVRVPYGGIGVVGQLQKGDSAGYAFLPERSAAKLGEGLVQPVQLVSQGFLGGFEREGQESYRFVLNVCEDVHGDSVCPLVGARQTESIMT